MDKRDLAIRQLRAAFERRPKRPLPPPLPFRQEATVLRLRWFHFIESMACYGLSRGDPDGFRTFLDLDVPEDTLGETVLRALDASRFIPPGDPAFDSVMRASMREPDPLLDAFEAEALRRAGVQTRATLYRGSVAVDVARQEGQITVSASPSRGIAAWGKEKGFPHPDIVLAETAAPVEIGRAVNAAIAPLL